jgi:dipeptidyl aminopeptidase/acylaminoacyl peptidase
MWGAGDRLVFVTELDNWPHLYSLPASGGEPVLLTPGNYMVEHIRMSPDGRSVLYSANSGPDADDIDRRHVFRVAVDRPGPAALSSGTNLEWTPAALAGGRVAYVSVTPTTPTRITVANADGSGARKLATPGADFAGSGMVVPRHVTFKAPDGLTIHGQLFGGGGDAAKKPALVFVHGGPPRQMLLGWSYMDYYAHAYAMNQYLASRGFVVLSVNYRLGIGYGRAFQHAPAGGLRGSSEYQDVLASARYLQKLPGVDPARIGIWGGSYGGLLTAQGLARNSDVFKAGVDLHGVHDFSLNRRVSQPQRYEQGDYAEAMKTAFDSSPVAFMDKWRSPVLLIHGDADGNVPFFQTVDLARRLQAKGVPFEELIFPNEVHSFLRYDTWLKTDLATIRFFEDKLKP